jgi:hypothetical protein
MISLIKYIVYSLAEILLCVGLALLYLFLCVAFLGDLYGILAVFLSVGIWAAFWAAVASITGDK